MDVTSKRRPTVIKAQLMPFPTEVNTTSFVLLVCFFLSCASVDNLFHCPVVRLFELERNLEELII